MDIYLNGNSSFVYGKFTSYRRGSKVSKNVYLESPRGTLSKVNNPRIFLLVFTVQDWESDTNITLRVPRARCGNNVVIEKRQVRIADEHLEANNVVEPPDKSGSPMDIWRQMRSKIQRTCQWWVTEEPKIQIASPWVRVQARIMYL